MDLEARLAERDVTLDEVLDYLDVLRESGETNMFGARPYVVRKFCLDKKLSGDVLTHWMRTCSI